MRSDKRKLEQVNERACFTSCILGLEMFEFLSLYNRPLQDMQVIFMYKAKFSPLFSRISIDGRIWVGDHFARFAAFTFFALRSRSVYFLSRALKNRSCEKSMLA